MTEIQDRAVSVYKELAKVPSLDSVSVINEDNILHWQAKWSHRDIARQAKISYTNTGSITCKDGELVSVKSPFTSEIATEKLMSISSSKLKARLQEIEVKSEKHHFLEIWKGSQKISSTDLTKENKHGLVHANPVFGCLNWSNASNKIVYVAEKKPTKSKSFFEKSEEGDLVGDEFIHKEDWGEQLVGSYHPTLFMFDVDSREITDLTEFLPDDVSIACALWSKNDRSLYILAWKASPWKLGLIYCKNRFSTLYKLDLENKKLTTLTDEKSCVFSPLITSDGNFLVYLESVPLGPHMQCYKLMCIDLKEDSEKSPRVVVDIVNQQSDSSRFQGLFIDRMTDDCWLSNGHQLIVASLHRSHIALLSIDIKSGDVKILEKEGAWNILRVENDILFASFSSPNNPTRFKVGKFDAEKISWIDIDVPVSKVDGVEWEILTHKPNEENQKYPGLDYESILTKPSADVPVRGLLVNPHGGPHALYFASFNEFAAGFCQLGFAVLQVNYRGSLGFGQNNVLSLPGNIGRQDVEDVQQAAERVAKDLSIPPRRIVVHGGSHGGFLTLQLVGQYPDFYSAGATRNPVANLSSFPGLTDIMDWCYYEGGEEFSYGKVASPEVVLKLLKCSPIIHVSKVKAPLLFMLGLDDLRVPPAQSVEYVHALQGLGKKVKVLAYPKNNHPIAAVDAEADCFVNMAKWFSEHSC